jgi:acyl-homoserine-lactone acylase
MLSPSDDSNNKEIISALMSWNRKAAIDSRGSAVFAVLYYKVVEEQNNGAVHKSLSKSKCLELLSFVKSYFEKNFGRTNVTLGEYQKLVRGDISLQLPGLPDVIASMYSKEFKGGKVKGDQGESYIELVKFAKDGPEIETVNCYGSSNKPESRHYADQMELFVQQKTKPMTLKKDKVYKEAVRIYHPIMNP